MLQDFLPSSKVFTGTQRSAWWGSFFVETIISSIGTCQVFSEGKPYQAPTVCSTVLSTCCAIHPVLLEGLNPLSQMETPERGPGLLCNLAKVPELISSRQKLFPLNQHTPRWWSRPGQERQEATVAQQWGQQTLNQIWAWIPALWITSYVTLGKSLNLSEP